MVRGSNPTLNSLRYAEEAVNKTCSYKGISLKTLLLLALTFLSAVTSVMLRGAGMEGAWGEAGVYWGIDNIVLLLLIGFAAFIAALLSTLIPRLAVVFAPVYAVCEGFIIGFISSLFEGVYSGVVFAALVSTVITFAVIVIMHRFEIFRATSRFRQIVYSVLITLSIVQFFFVMVSFFYGEVFYDFTECFWLQLIVSAFFILLASSCILIDLQNIEDYVGYGISRKYEWVAALGIEVSLIWLYLQFLRLFALISSRKN